MGQQSPHLSAQIVVRVAGDSYPVIIQEGLLGRTGEALKERTAGRKIFVVSDHTVWKLWGKKLLESLRPLEPKVICIPPGEQHKSMATVEKIAQQLSAEGAERSSLLLALGGGVVGDIAGFVASIFLRGIDYVQIPTTLLAQVDSSIGGKTGVNLVIGKNLVGTFYHPRAVLSDPGVLRTLPPRELHAGLFEAIKCAVIGDPDLFDFLWVAHRSVLSGNPAALQHVIQACAALKGGVVSRDERESDLRRLLNFGHTLGHAIEAATHYRRFLHGEAVAWGMLAATRLAVDQRVLAPKDAARITALLAAYGPVPPLGKISPEEIAVHLGVDKKIRDGQIHFVLPRHIGEAVVVPGISIAQALQVTEELMHDDLLSGKQGIAGKPRRLSPSLRSGMANSKLPNSNSQQAQSPKSK